MNYVKTHSTNLLKYALIALPFLALGIILFQRYALGYTDWAAWTGLGELDGPNGTIVRPARTLWDVVQLLVIPVVLSLGVLFFNQQERKTERRLSEDRTEDAVLQNYLDRVSELILNRSLMEEEKTTSSPVHKVAQVRTVTALRQLATHRQNAIFQFLRDTDLCQTMLTDASLLDIDLRGAHLWGISFNRSSLIRARMGNASLFKAFLSEAKLIDADFSGCLMTGADLSNALLLRTNFRGADLTGANLTGANLSGAKWEGANLNGADLTGAYKFNAAQEHIPVTAADLRGAISITGAVFPDGSIPVE